MKETQFTALGCQFKLQSFSGAGDATPPHQHGFEHVTIVMSGDVRAVVAGAPDRRMLPGDRLLLSANGVHHFVSDAEKSSIVHISRTDDFGPSS